MCVYIHAHIGTHPACTRTCTHWSFEGNEEKFSIILFRNSYCEMPPSTQSVFLLEGKITYTFRLKQIKQSPSFGR